MEDQPTFIEVSSGHVILEEEDEFRSCCGEDGEWKEKDEIVKAVDDINDESVVRIYFKGVSLDGIREDCSGQTGIGVVIEQSGKLPAVFVQKKLDFYVKDLVADYLALLDGLAEAVKIKAGKVVAFTDSSGLCNQEKDDMALNKFFQDMELKKWMRLYQVLFCWITLFL